MSPIRKQVVVVGGGPVGMVIAAELSGYGVDTLVLEQESRTCQRPKATTLHARTVQSLARRGYLPAPELPSTPGTASSPFHFAGISGLDITAPAAEPTPLLKRDQADLERLFEDHARSRGAKVLRAHRMVEIHPQPSGVRVVAQGPRNTAVYHADYLVGADGARGTVRTQAGIKADRFQATLSAMMGLVHLDDPDALRVGWHRTERGWVVSKDAPDGQRHIRTVNFARTHPDRSKELLLDELQQETSQIMGHQIAMSRPQWLSRFSDYARLARTYRTGRVLLAGDAAHVHFPIGGQGLSTGLLDALNLGWKLAATVGGTASQSLLDSYDTERRPAARRVIDNVRAQVSLMHPQPRLDSLRQLFDQLLTDGRSGPYLSAMISAQDTVLPPRSTTPSTWEGTFLHNTTLITPSGQSDVIRLLQDGRMLLLLLDPDSYQLHEKAAQDFSHLLHIVRSTPTHPLAPAALLVRPDGYIAWAPDGGGLHTALSTYLSPSHTTGPHPR